MTDKSKDKKKKKVYKIINALVVYKNKWKHAYWSEKRKLRQKRLTSIHDFCYETKLCFYFDYFHFKAKIFASKWKNCLNLLAFVNDLKYFHIILSFS